MDSLLRISDLARIVGRQSSTIRRWEREGRIPVARREPVTNYRVWTVDEVERIEQLLEATLTEKRGQS